MLCGILAAATATQAQYKSGSMVEYKVIWDNPDKIKPVVISLDLLTADTWNTSSYMGYGVRADVNAPRFGSLLFDYRKGYLGDKQRAIELGGALNLFSSRRTRSMRVVLSSSSFAYGTKLFFNSSSINVQGKRKTMLQARGGIASFNTNIAPTAAEISGSFYMQKDTTRVPITDRDKNFRGVSTFSAALKSQIYYVGLSIRTINNVVVSHGKGVASNSNNYNFYADVLTGGDPQFSSVQYTYTASALGLYNFPKGTTPSQYELVAGEVKKMGWRVGWEAKTNNGLGLSYKAEFGSRPGYKGGSGILSSNSYLMLAAGFSIGAGKNYKKLMNEERKKG